MYCRTRCDIALRCNRRGTGWILALGGLASSRSRFPIAKIEFTKEQTLIEILRIAFRSLSVAKRNLESKDYDKINCWSRDRFNQRRAVD